MVLGAGWASYKACYLLYILDRLYYDIETLQQNMDCMNCLAYSILTKIYNRIKTEIQERLSAFYSTILRPSDSSITGSLQPFACVSSSEITLGWNIRGEP